MVSASSLLLPSSVRDFASCIAATDVAACAHPSSTLTSSSVSVSGSGSKTKSTSTLSVTVSYLAAGGSSPLLLRLTWAHTPLGGSALYFAPSASSPSVLLRRRRGTRSVAVDDASAGPGWCSEVVVFWDLIFARYGPAAGSPEPLSGYYFVAVAGSDVVLAVGDLADEFIKAKFEGQVSVHGRSSLPLARRERVLAPNPAAMHAARVRFAEGGPEHEVSVGCSGAEGAEELWVSVDGKRAVQARRLRLNFRGNQTIFVDGAPVDVMWDLHRWWFRESPGCAVVMLRARSALESRLWLEEEEDAAAAAAPVFSLVVEAFKSPP